MSSTCCLKSGACAPGNANASNDACNRGDVRRPVGSKGAGITTPSRTTFSRFDSAGAGVPAATARSASTRRCPLRPMPRSIRPGYNASTVPKASTT